MPTYNRADFIVKSLESVFLQYYRPIEIIIVDDGSIDNTKEVVEKWSNTHNAPDFQTRYIKQENNGAPSARNRGIKEAKGQFLQFLDSDDILKPNKLSLQIEQLLKENTPICICDYNQIDSRGNIIRKASNNRNLTQIISDYKYLHTSIGVIDKTHFKKGFLKWNPKIKKLQDRDFYLKIFLVINKFSYVEIPLFDWIRHEGDRIFDSTPYTRRIFSTNLKSLILFHLKNRNKIAKYKVEPLKKLYFYLFKQTRLGNYIFRIIPKIPESLRVWKL